ncbi:hypothetical protein [Roseofilum capinflatum]|uniref:Uncharacterized protein n=1 Tax=Roseofilum capinflatum BLCC-M114 TaxID=3022440 RepID=A0ABT7B298_9CYAN|nr:hypothetical protein [Roseofilum capinflatum]MDJ1173293.1 hypothetical protein [Roseofilum capinflatum BLCC-M114]
MLNITEALSDVSRTNQLKITESPEEVAEKLFQYLFKINKGIEHFSIKGWFSKEEYSQPDFYKKRHKAIKNEIQKRLLEYGEEKKYSDIQYFFSYSNGDNNVFFLSPNKTHSGWKRLFSEKQGNSFPNRDRIFNLIFKVYILSQESAVEMIDGFEELLLVHSRSLSKSKDALFVWGQNLFVNYNYFDILTLTLTRKRRLFLPKDDYRTLDGDDLGELLVYKNKKYYFDRDLDARKKNEILFMRFEQDFDKFKKTQLYCYQNLITQLENFLSECGINYERRDFQTDCYLEKSFIKNVESVEFLEVINNTGDDFNQSDQDFLQCLLNHQGVLNLTFYNNGKTISSYKPVELDNEEDSCWEITEVIPWSNVKLDENKNYLVFNKLLEKEADSTGSMAYQGDDGLWYASTKINGKPNVDFYSQLKNRFNYMETEQFFSIQGINISEFKAIKDDKNKELKKTLSVLIYNTTNKKIDEDKLREDTKDFTDRNILDIEGSIISYIKLQQDSEQWNKFCGDHKIKISPEVQKVLIELGIKSWVRESLNNPSYGLRISPQSFSEKRFFAIYVRSPRNEEAKAVAVEFLYKESYIYVNNVMHDMKEINKRFRFLRRRSNSDTLKDNQQYFVDESEKIYISCYTDDFFTPTLIGRNGIVDELENGQLKINRQVKGKNSTRLLPLVSYYNGEIQPFNKIHNMVCFDLKNETFIQYYVPPAQSLDTSIKRGFRVYHLLGKSYDDKPIPTSELIKHPITALHFTTLTQNVLRISDNSQSSLLQKAAKVLIEN